MADFQKLLQSFFDEWLVGMRNVSQHTVSSYADAFRMLILWLHETRGTSPGDIGFADLGAEELPRFVSWLEEARGNSAKTVNCRLAAIKSFAEFVSFREPSLSAWARDVRALPQRKARVPALDYLTGDEVAHIVATCDLSSANGVRYDLILRMLYNTGARVSELAALRVRDVTASHGRWRVTLFGKGRKERTVPLWGETGEAFEAYVSTHALPSEGFLFPGRGTDHITRSGIRTIVERHCALAATGHPELAGRKVTPHTFRHSAAMSLLESGVNLSTIAIWLGHESIETTHKYMVASVELKEKALGKVTSPPGAAGGRYHADADLLEFLKALSA